MVGNNQGSGQSNQRQSSQSQSSQRQSSQRQSNGEILQRFFQQNRRRRRAIELAEAERAVRENHPPVRIRVEGGDDENGDGNGKKISFNLYLNSCLIVSRSP